MTPQDRLVSGAREVDEGVDVDQLAIVLKSDAEKRQLNPGDVYGLALSKTGGDTPGGAARPQHPQVPRSTGGARTAVLFEGLGT